MRPRSDSNLVVVLISKIEARPGLGRAFLLHPVAHVQKSCARTRSDFDVEAIRSAVHDRTCSRPLRSCSAQQQEAPDEHLVRFTDSWVGS